MEAVALERIGTVKSSIGHWIDRFGLERHYLYLRARTGVMSLKKAYHPSS